MVSYPYIGTIWGMLLLLIVELGLKARVKDPLQNL